MKAATNNLVRGLTHNMNLNICVSANSKYMRYLYIMLLSLLESNVSHDILVYVFHRDFTESDKARITELFAKYGQTVKFLYVEASKYLGLPEASRITLESYFRFEILSQIPIEIDRILYLDVDMIIRKDISALFHIPIEGYYFAACQDMIAGVLLPKHRVLFNRFDDLRYFNAGMMVWNLVQLRHDHVTFEELFKVAEELEFNLPFHDQDILNYKFYNKTLYLDAEKYNFMVTKYLRDGWNDSDMGNSASILHFTGVSPWGVGPKTPIYKIWWQYAKKTPFYVELLKEQLERDEEYILNQNCGWGRIDYAREIKNECLRLMDEIKGTGLLRKEIVDSHKSYILWGGGYLGKAFCDLTFSENVDEHIAAILDNRAIVPIHGIPVYNDFDWVEKNKTYIVIITPSYDQDAIKLQIESFKKENINTITLLEFLKQVICCGKKVRQQ